jgi:2-dehydropantoate 2-reductase
MKVCIVGAGAIGGFIGTRLAAAGEARVSALARGATLEALRAHGWLGAQDLVVVAVKGPALTAVARALGPLLGPQTVVLPAMNGVPWWFGDGVAAIGSAPLHSVDPGGVVAAAVAPGRVLGCVVHASTAVAEPGLVSHRMGRGLIVGEPRGGRSERAARTVALLAAAGFDVTHSDQVRRDVWYKLWGNLTMNPVSAITGASGDRILADPQVRAFCSAAMREAAEIGALIGCPIDQSPEDRHAMTAKLGAFRTSMLQDAEAGRAIELDAIVGAVRELGARVGVATPTIDALYGLTRLFGRVHGLYPDPPAA